MKVTPHLLAQLRQISVFTVRRILARARQDEPRLPRKGPGKAHWAVKGAPMTRIPCVFYPRKMLPKPSGPSRGNESRLQPPTSRRVRGAPALSCQPWN